MENEIHIVIYTGSPEENLTAHSICYYAAFGFFGTALQEKMGAFHSGSLKMAPKTPNASSHPIGVGIARLAVHQQRLA
jgi:hypothetical protein